MQNDDVKKRREFLKNSLTAGALGAVALAAAQPLAAQTLSAQDESQNGVIKGKSSKREVLYKPTAAWQNYYNVVK